MPPSPSPTAEHEAFARHFESLYRELHRLGVRRVADGREGLSDEATALLLHLAQAGPMTLSELAQHLGRALSTLSAKVSALEAQGLLARQRDGDDARRALIWLGPAGRAALDEALQVLDTRRLAVAAQALPEAQRAGLLQALQGLIDHLPPPEPEPPR